MKRIILVDGNSIMYRAYFATAKSSDIMQTENGLFTNAVFNFARMILTLTKSNYDYILVAFDKGKHTFRHDIMETYKGGRSPMPDELRMQIPLIHELLECSNIKYYMLDDYEADDIIGTVSLMAKNEGIKVDIYSSDKDLLQLVDDTVTVNLNKTGMSDIDAYTPDRVFERYTLTYNQMIDLKALMGDNSDNLKGIPGVGEKTAIKLLNTYQTLEGIIEHKDEIKGSLGEKIRTSYEDALLTKKMVTICRTSPIEITLDDLAKKDHDVARLKEFYTKVGFKSFLRDLEPVEKTSYTDVFYTVIDNPVDVKGILLPNSTVVFETLGHNYHTYPLIAIAIKNVKGNFVMKPNLLYESIDLQLFLADFENNKNVNNYKLGKVALMQMGLDLNGVAFDMLLGSYLVNPSLGKEEFKGVASYFGYDEVYYDEQIYGKGSKKSIPTDFNLVYEHIVRKAIAIYVLKNKIISKLKEEDSYSLLVDMEIPLAKVLAKMEFEGIKVNKEELNRQKEDLIKRIKEKENAVFALVGHEFNLSSPKQLGVVLFEELALPNKKKNKNGYSTDNDVLEGLRDSHEIIPLIIEHRQLSKLYSTYIDSLESCIYPDGKIHTIYEQALTQTGRLSSVEPNLQNIPIRTSEGRNIRKIFVPSQENNSFYSADYSQIELRVLAHVASVSKLVEAFNNGEDIHERTAKEIFGKDEITKDERRKAKAVNFGIVYGISAYGLSQDINISVKEAQEFIDKYLFINKEIKTYMDSVIEFAKANNYVKTIKNRRRYIPDINSSVYMQREFAKRTAMNAPIQGSAADIIKIAMINVDELLRINKLRSKMLLTIHDELIFECVKGEEEALEKIVKDGMENAYKMVVPLKIEGSFGSDLFEVK